MAGLLAGFAATWVMTRFQEAWNEVQKAESKDGDKAGGTPESEQHEDETATVKTAKVISRKVFHHELSRKEKSVAGAATHLGFGATVGTIYGALAEYYPAVTVGEGLGYGTAVWGLADNVAAAPLGLSKGPTGYPLSTSVHGLS